MYCIHFYQTLKPYFDRFLKCEEKLAEETGEMPTGFKS